MKKCLLTKAFLTKRRHQRKTPSAIYKVGSKFKLIFGKSPVNNNLENSLENPLTIRLSASIPSAFGTINLHPTTHWCIEMIEKHLKNEKVLDVGVGAGVLTICMLRLIIEEKKNLTENFRVDAFDIYQDAIRQAKINLRLNAVEKRVNLKQGLLSDYPNNFYSLVIANLPPIAISELWLQLLEKVEDKGKLILSGILNHNFSSILEKITNKGFKLVDKVVTDLWCLIVVEKVSTTIE